VPGILHLRLVSAIHKPTTGRLTQFIQSVDVAERATIFDVISAPRPGSVTVLDDRPLAGAIGALTAEAGVSIAFAALIAHAQMTGQPILADPANAARWTAVALARGWRWSRHRPECDLANDHGQWPWGPPIAPRAGSCRIAPIREVT